MPLEQTGVKLILDGYSQFISGLAMATKSIAQLGGVSKSQVAAIQALGKTSAQLSVQATKLAQEITKESKAHEQHLTALAKARAEKQKAVQVANALAVAQQKTIQSANKLATSQQATIRSGNALADTQNRNLRSNNALAASQLATIRSGDALADTQNKNLRSSNALAAAQERTVQSANKLSLEHARLKTSLVQVIIEKIRAKTAAMGLAASQQSLGSATNTASLSFGKLTGAIALGNIVANAAATVFRNLWQQLTGMGKAAITAAGELQTLTIRLENLIARQYRMIDSTMSVEESLELASKRTQELTTWIQQLALTTPFNVDDISHTYSMAMAMGWTAEESKNLTSAILNYSAGMGLASDQMERIIFNFAQMKAAGKVTATEMRDLARGAFFPLTQVLDEAAKNLGIAASGLIEFRKAASEGAIGIEEFFDAFMTVVNRDFPDAAQKMNITLAALKDNVKDFFETIIGWEILGPVVAKFALTASNALAKLTKTIQTGGWTKLSYGLVFLFDSVTAAVKDFFGAFSDILAAFGFATPTVRDFSEALAALGIIITAIASGFRGFVDKYVVPFITSIREYFSGMATDAWDWGSGLITEFANGIVETAATVITAAMQWISDAIAGWLQPGSPPKILPEIDEWGAQAMAEYLHGFTMADFDVLDSVQGLVEDALSALVDLGDLGETEAGEMFLGLSEDLIVALENFRDTGEIGQEIFNQLADIGGGFGEELALLLEQQIALADAIQYAADAQEELNAAQAATKQATSDVKKLVREYNALLRAGADKKTLDAKLAQINAAEDELKLARERETEAEAAKEAADAALEPLREAVELQEKLIEQLIKLAQAQADLWDTGGGGGEDEGGDEDEEEWPEIPGGDDISGQLDNWFDQIKQSMMNKLSTAWEELMAAWMNSINSKGGAILSALKAIWDMVLSYWTQISANLSQAWKNFWDFIDTYGAGILTNLAAAFGTLVGFVTWLALEIALFLSEVALDWSEWLLANGPLITAFSGYIAYLATKFAELGQSWWTSLKPALEQIDEVVQTALTEFMKFATSEAWKSITDSVFELGAKVGELVGWLVQLAGVVIEHAIIAFGKWWEDNGDNVATIVERLTKVLGALVDIITTDETKSFITEVFDAIYVVLGDLAGLPIALLAGDMKSVADQIARLVAFFTFQGQAGDSTWLYEALTKIQEVIQAIADAIPGVWTILSNLFSEESITDVQNNAKGIGDGIVDGVIDGFEAKGLELTNAGIAVGQLAVDSVANGAGAKSPSKITYQTGVDIMQGLINGMESKLEELKALAKEIGKYATEGVAEGSESESPSKATYQTGLDIMQGLINGINDSLDNAKAAIVAALEDIFSDLDTEGLFDLGGAFSGFGSSLVSMYKKQTLDPLEQQAEDMDDQISELQALIASGTLSSYAQIAAESELAQLMEQRAALSEEIAANEQKILEFQEQQQKLEFLKMQMDLIKTLEEYGLNPEDILGGMTLGVDASIEELLAAMTRAMEAIVAQAEDELGIGSPSKVFMEIGQQITAGFVQGIANTIGNARAAMGELVGNARQQAARGAIAPTMQAQPTMQQQNVSFGNVTINDRMDWATFKNQVQRAVMES